MKRVLGIAALLALLAICSATVECDNYLNNSTYREALGRWIAVYTWPGVSSSEYYFGFEFTAPTTEEIQSHRVSGAQIDTLTVNPKLVAKKLFMPEEALLDISADKITRVKGYYNANNYVTTDQFKLRRIGDFLVIDFCKNGNVDCVIDKSWMLHSEMFPNRASITEAVTCVVVPGTRGYRVTYRSD